MAKKFDSEIYFLNVCPPEFTFYTGLRTDGVENQCSHEEMKEKEGEEIKTHEELLQSFLKKFNLDGLKINHIVKTGPPFLEIILTAKEINAHLIVMGTHGRTGLAHAMLGSVTEKVVRKAYCPVLTVKPKDLVFKMP
jgi:nucleotide-binding universal stress UspA family protein